MKLLSIALNKNTEFSVIGIANINNGTVKFQGLLNNTPFTESRDFHKIRERVVKAVEINQVSKNEELS